MFLHILDAGAKGKGVAALFALVACLGAVGMLVSCKATPDIQVSVLLEALTADEYAYVGTSGIENPTIDDFKKLIVRIDTRGLENREIDFPSIEDIRGLLTSDVLWFGSSGSMDNASQPNAYYWLETTLFTRKLTNEALWDKLSMLSISVFYTDKQGQRVYETYNLGEHF